MARANKRYYQSNGVQKSPINGMGNYINPFTDRRLEIFDLKTCRKAIVYRCTGFKKWTVEASAKFYYKDCDASDYRIREYFGFLKGREFEMA